MVTVRNDIESATNGIMKAKEVNLQQIAPGPKIARRRSYRCVTLVGLVVLFLLALGVVSVFVYEHTVDHIPMESTDGSPTVEGSSTELTSTGIGDSRAELAGPTSIDTFDPNENLAAKHPTEDDGGDPVIYIDSDESTDREEVTDNNAPVSDDDDASSEGDNGSGSGSGDGADFDRLAEYHDY